MDIIYTSDDAGATASVTRRILEAWHAGWLNGFSFLVNGEAVNTVRDDLLRHQELEARLSVHLNLSEGPCTAPQEHVGTLVDDHGILKLRFLGLWLRYLGSSQAQRDVLTSHITQEFRAQIAEAQDLVRPRTISALDSHMHLHMLPFVFPIVAALAKESGIGEVRISREPLYMSSNIRESLRAAFAVNIIKHLVLRYCSLKALLVAKKHGLRFCDCIIGILYTGMMSETTVPSGLAAARRKDLKSVEVVMHVGRADQSEIGRWKYSPSLVHFYIDRRRDLEHAALKKMRSEKSEGR